jgi:hypothetical protein
LLAAVAVLQAVKANLVTACLLLMEALAAVAAELLAQILTMILITVPEALAERK